MEKPLALASDAAGIHLKQAIMKNFDASGIAYVDYGTYTEESCDYPQYAKAACEAVQEQKSELAILFCGTGIGMSIAANKMQGIRACACSDTFSAEMTRLHNDANVLCLGERVVGPGLAQKLVDIFLATSFEGGRHQRRVDQITALEK